MVSTIACFDRPPQTDRTPSCCLCMASCLLSLTDIVAPLLKVIGSLSHVTRLNSGSHKLCDILACHLDIGARCEPVKELTQLASVPLCECHRNVCGKLLGQIDLCFLWFFTASMIVVYDLVVFSRCCMC